MIQIRNVPDALHRELKVRAARAGQSLSEFLLGELRRVAGKPTLDELWERVQAHGTTPDLLPPAAEILRDARDADDARS